MKKAILAVALVAGLGVSGCNSTNPGERAVVGGGLGAATGAVIAAAAGANPGTTLGVAAATGAAGAIAGAATTPRCVNQWGEPVPCP